MRKTNNKINIPESLNSDLTNQRRNEIIQAGCYPTDKNIHNHSAFKAKVKTYNSRYKCDDIKERLESLYHEKCVYCEKRIEEYQIEHYRPKSIYYWLAYSWDNLLISCGTCNPHKGAKFEVKNRISINDYSIDDIHNLGNVYDKFEQPTLMNPTREDFYKYLIFSKKGEVYSKDKRVKKTIEACKIGRKRLNDWRKLIYDDYNRDTKQSKRTISNPNASEEAKQKAEDELELHIIKFVKAMNNPKSNFTSFQRYIFNNWL